MQYSLCWLLGSLGLGKAGLQVTGSSVRAVHVIRESGLGEEVVAGMQGRSLRGISRLRTAQSPQLRSHGLNGLRARSPGLLYAGAARMSSTSGDSNAVDAAKVHS